MELTKIILLILVALITSCNASESEIDINSTPNQPHASESEVPAKNMELQAYLSSSTVDNTQTKNEKKLRDSYFQCLDSAAGVTPQMQDCIDEEFDFQENRLRDIDQRLINRANRHGQTALKTAHEEWVIDRDKSCSSNRQEGQGSRLETNACVLERTAKRATEMESQLEPI